MSLPPDNFGRSVTKTTVGNFDIYTVSTLGDLTFPINTPQNDVYNTINSYWPDGYSPPPEPEAAQSIQNTGVIIDNDNTLTANAFISTVETGNPPFTVTSTTVVPNLRAQFVDTNANLTGPITSVGNATSVASQTGTGSTFVMNTSPTLITPNIGVATGTWNGSIILGQYGGTGVNNGSSTVTLGGNFTTSGAFTTELTITGNTNVTLPTTGTLAITSQLPTPASLTRTNDTNVTLTLGGTPTTALLQATSITAGWAGQLSLTRGGTNASLTASNGGIFYSTASAGAILSGTATAGQILRSGASAAPSWSTATWPATTTANQLLYSSAINTVGGLTSANSASLVTSSTGVPIWSSTMTNGQLIIGSTGATPVAASLTAGSGISITPGAGTITIAATGGTGTVTSVSGTTDRITITGTPTVAPVVDISSSYIGQTSITTLGTITSGTWNAGIIPGQYGGTGVANTGRTITLGGNLTTSGAFATTLTMTGTTNVTLPTSGTLLSNTPAALTKTDDTNVTITLGGTPTTALLQATSITAGWTGTLAPTRGGTGVNNGSNTLTLGGNLTTSGTFATTLTMTGTTNITLPTTGTLLNNSLTSANFYVGSVGGVATGVPMSGDATLANTGALTLANTAVVVGSYTSANLTVDSKGRITAASSSPGLVSKTTVTAITNNSNQTWTAAQMFGGIITRNCNGAARTDTTATAALLRTQFITSFGRNPVIGDTVLLLVINNSAAANTLTVAVGAGVTHVATNQTLTVNAGKNTLMRFANVTPGSEAVVMYWDY